LKKGIAAIAAVFGMLAITSGAFAAHHYIISSSSQIKNGAVSLSDLSKGARNALHGSKGVQGIGGPAGPQSPKGNAGPQGPKGADGLSGYEVRTWRYSKDDANSDMGPGYVGVGGGAIATVACSTGKVALGGGYWFTSPHDNGFNAPAISDGSGVVASFPGRMDWSTNTVKPNDHSCWIVQVNDKVNAADMTLYVICANVDH